MKFPPMMFECQICKALVWVRHEEQMQKHVAACDRKQAGL